MDIRFVSGCVCVCPPGRPLSAAAAPESRSLLVKSFLSSVLQQLQPSNFSHPLLLSLSPSCVWERAATFKPPSWSNWTMGQERDSQLRKRRKRDTEDGGRTRELMASLPNTTGRHFRMEWICKRMTEENVQEDGGTSHNFLSRKEERPTWRIVCRPEAVSQPVKKRRRKKFSIVFDKKRKMDGIHRRQRCCCCCCCGCAVSVLCWRLLQPVMFPFFSWLMMMGRASRCSPLITRCYFPSFLYRVPPRADQVYVCF